MQQDSPGQTVLAEFRPQCLCMLSKMQYEIYTDLVDERLTGSDGDSRGNMEICEGII